MRTINILLALLIAGVLSPTALASNEMDSQSLDKYRFLRRLSLDLRLQSECVFLTVG